MTYLKSPLGTKFAGQESFTLNVEDLDVGFKVWVWFPEEAYSEADYQEYRQSKLI